MNDNPYAAPAFQASEPGPSNGSVEAGLSGQYDADIAEIMREAWRLTKGSKSPLLGALLIMAVLSGSVSMLMRLAGLDGAQYLENGEFLKGMLMSQASGMMAMPVTGPMFAGLMMMAVRRASGRDIRVSEVFRYYPRVVPLVLLMWATGILTFLGYAVLILPGIYLTVAYSMVTPLLLEKNLGVWEAMETSRRALTHQWFNVFGLFIGAWLVLMASMCTLGIALIWTFPWFAICLGVLYRRVFGVQTPVPENA